LNTWLSLVEEVVVLLAVGVEPVALEPAQVLP
jgi:hypothetical protein